MKKILILLILAAGLNACQDNTFVDFDFTGGYFPNQYSVKVFDLANASDTTHSFIVPIVMGGVYKNTQERIFNFEIAPELCNKALFESTKDTISLLPSTHYTLSSANQIIIPAGKLNGSIEVKLTDAFFNDPLASKLHYVIPIRIISVTGLDSVLRGKSSLNNPDVRVASQWSILPKDYIMISVKYISQYQGNYFHRGVSVVKDPTEKIIENTIYNQNTEIWNLLPKGQNMVYVNGARNSKFLSGNAQINLNINSSGSILITDAAGTSIGTGQFIKDGEVIGSIIRNKMVLAYKYSVQYTAPTPENPVKTVDDNDSKINYSGSWSSNSDALFYGGTRHYSNSGSFVYTFTGDGVALYWKTGPTYGAFDVYLDDMTVPVKVDVSTVTPTMLYKQKLYEVSGLPLKSHTIKVVIKNSKNTYFDYLTYNVTQVIIPSGAYTYEANDTIVVKDRIFPVDTFTPLVY